MGSTWRGRGCALAAACTAALAAPAVASAGTVSWWHMDETSGSTMRDSIGSNDGSLHSVTLGQPGFAGLGYVFNGSSSVVTVPNDSSLNPGDSSFWMSVHVKFKDPATAAIGGDYDVMRKGLSSTSGGFYKMELFPNGQLHCSMQGSTTSRSVQAGPNLMDDKWHTIQCLKDDSSISAWVDGHKVASASVSLGSFGNSAQFAVGAKAEGGDWYKGSLDEAAFGTGELAAPSNSALPAVSGTLVAGSPLSASNGTWGGTQPITYAYQWQRCDAAGGHCGAIAGATAATYTPAAGDVGSALRFVVTATNPVGTGNATSAATGVVAAPATTGTGAGGGPAATGPLTPVNVIVLSQSGTSTCTRVLPGSAVRRAKLHGGKATLRFDARTRTARIVATRGTARSVTFTLDGKRLRRARGGRSNAILPSTSLRVGAHVLRVTVHPRHGRARTLVVHLTFSAC